MTARRWLLLGGTVLWVGVVAICATAAPTVVPAVVSGMAVALVVYVARLTRSLVSAVGRLDRRVGALNDEVTRNHKRASEWDHRMRIGLGIGGATQPDSPRRGRQGPGAAACACSGAGRATTEWAEWAASIESAASLSIIVCEPDSRNVREQTESLAEELRAGGVDVELVPAGACLDCQVFAARGRTLVLLRPDVECDGATVRQLLDDLAAGDASTVHPLLVDGTGTIVTAGFARARPGARPSRILAGHPASDAASPAPGCLHVLASAGALVVVRALDVALVGGIARDRGPASALVDLSLRVAAARRLPAGTSRRAQAVLRDAGPSDGEVELRGDEDAVRVLEASGAVPSAAHTYASLGLRLAHVGVPRSAGEPPPIITVRHADDGPRWGIRIASEAGVRGERWGDTHFARSLARSLRARGHATALYHQGGHLVPAAALDDISLAIRGRYRAQPVPGRVNVLWVISHPGSVTYDEARQFDVVLAASEPWARARSAEWGIHVGVLLQCTDAGLFTVHGVRNETSRPLFVGSEHPGRTREVVAACVRAGTRIDIVGSGWADRLPEGWLRGAYVDNAALPAHYRGAPVVIADHWQDMAAHGFIQNRVFDALACGVPVITNPVAGLEDVFPREIVRSYESPEELASLVTAQPADLFADREARLEWAERVRVEHSFDSRAGELVALGEELV